MIQIQLYKTISIILRFARLDSVLNSTKKIPVIYNIQLEFAQKNNIINYFLITRNSIL